ncbi:hypothetical protein [Bacillus cereus]|uniref:hypothetical protein n=1 Tax=Bacillus cereus TaxID=1396 RepID=UPI003012E288
MRKKYSFFVVDKIVGKMEEYLMNIIYIKTKNQYKSEKENEMETILIINRVYYENGEIKFEILGEQKVPMTWLDK